MSLIYMFGPDGSGKSMLARALALQLKSRGFKIRVSWMRGTHTLSSLLARLLSRFAVFRGSGNPYYNISISGRMRRVWQLVEFISMLPVLFSRFMLPSMLGYTVIAERYLPDFLVWVAITTGDTGYLRRLEARFLLYLSVKAAVRIHVTASREELLRRRGGEVNLRILDRQIKLYDGIEKFIGAQRIDTSRRTLGESLNLLLGILSVRGIL